MKDFSVICLVICFTFESICSGFLLKNVGSGLCVKDIRPERPYWYSMEQCSEGIATNFTLSEGAEGSLRLTSIYTQPEGRRPNRKCAVANVNGKKDWADVNSGGCNGQDTCPYYQWTVEDIGDEKFVMIHTMSAWCVKPDKYKILIIAKNCDKSDSAFQWTKIE